MEITLTQQEIKDILKTTKPFLMPATKKYDLNYPMFSNIGLFAGEDKILKAIASDRHIAVIFDVKKVDTEFYAKPHDDMPKRPAMITVKELNYLATMKTYDSTTVTLNSQQREAYADILQFAEYENKYTFNDNTFCADRLATILTAMFYRIEADANLILFRKNHDVYVEKLAQITAVMPNTMTRKCSVAAKNENTGIWKIEYEDNNHRKVLCICEIAIIHNTGNNY